ncbi:tape measure protein [Arthrobacter sp. lap29]|uniref:tape measure protein n=1 Tax=Arthrobacter sp. lap29 TaxID=3056122 RepID=UPI0028F7317A|nr:tape measure protein [Arthrobacter sp. lap29]
MTKAGQGEVEIVPVMGGFRSTVDSEVETTGKSSSNRFAAAFGNGIKGLGAFVGKSLAVAGGLAAGIAAIAVKGGISRQLQIEDATAKMSGLGNSTETVKSAMDSAMTSVKGTAFGMGEAATVASTALASGIEPGKRMSEYLSLVADAATIAGTGMGEMGQIMGKVTNTGKVTNDVLNQFGDRGVGVLQMLAKEYGVTAEEMTSMVSKGKVDAATFEKVLTENLGGAAKKSGDTTKGAFANMGAALSRVGVTMSSGFFPLFKGVFNQVTATLDGMNDKIKPAAEAFGKWFQGKAGPAIEGFSTKALAAFNSLYTRVALFVAGFQQGMSNVEASGAMGRVQRFGEIAGNVFKEMRGGIWAFQASWEAFDGDVTSSGFPGFMERLAFITKSAFIEMRGGIWAFQAAWAANDGDVTSSGFPGFMERVANATRPVVDAFKALDFSSFSAFTASLSGAGGNAGKSLGSIGDSIQTLLPAFKSFGEQLPNIGAALVKLGGVSLNILTTSLAFLAKHVDTIIAWMPAIVAGYIAWKIASSALGQAHLALTAAQVLMTPVNLANNAARIIAVTLENQHARAIGTTTTALNLNVVTMARQKAAIVAGRIATLAGAAATGVATAATGLFNAVMSANPIALVVLAIVALIAGIILLVKNWGAVTGFLKTIWQGFVSWFQGVMAGFLGWWDGVWQGFLGFITPVWAAIQQIIQIAWAVIVTVVTTYIGMVLTVIQTVWAVIQVVFSTAWNIIQTIVATALAILIAVFTGNFGAIGGLIASAWEKIKGYFTGAFAAIGAIVGNAWATLTAIFTVAMAQVKALLSGGWNSVRDTVMSVWNSIVSWISGIPGRVLNGIIAIAQLHIRMGQWIGSVKDAAVSKFLELVSWVTGLPGRIVSALGSVGSLLSEAGRNIIQGFLNGLTAGFESVKNFVGGIGKWIADHKGPEAYDRALLVPAGGWIMGGLNKSLRAGIPDLKSTLGDVSATIRAGITSTPTSSTGTAGTQTSTQRDAGLAGPLVQIIGNVGWDPEKVGDELYTKIRRSSSLANLRRVAVAV